MKTFAGIASLPGRPLQRVVRSLILQVDAVGVWLNGYSEVPEWLQRLSDHSDVPVVCRKDNQGSSRKLRWADAKPEAVYFACDDDLEYPPDYVATMMAEYERWGPRVIVTACGRTLKEHPTGWRDWVGEGRYVAAVPEARWINYVGGCAFAFHTSLKLPVIDPPNEEEAILSVWAQRHDIPIRLVARPYDWPKRIPLAPGAFTLYEEAARERFATRSAIIRSVDQWVIHTPSEVPA